MDNNANTNPGKKPPNHEKLLAGKRILVCGKGGSGKSSFITLMGRVLVKKGLEVILLDGDASNPGGLVRLLFGLKQGPAPLIEFFGGRDIVGCPVDNPCTLTRLNDAVPLSIKQIRVEEIPKEYVMKEGNLILLQGGKILNAYEGCDGPMSKVSRDFIVGGEQVTLIDVEAGIEHFGRGIEKNVDCIIVMVDPTYESFLIAEKVSSLAFQMGKSKVWAVLNRVRTLEMQQEMLNELNKRKIKVLGSVLYDQKVEWSGFTGKRITAECEAFADVDKIVGNLIEQLT